MALTSVFTHSFRVQMPTLTRKDTSTTWRSFGTFRMSRSPIREAAGCRPQVWIEIGLPGH